MDDEDIQHWVHLSLFSFVAYCLYRITIRMSRFIIDLWNWLHVRLPHICHVKLKMITLVCELTF